MQFKEQYTDAVISNTTWSYMKTDSKPASTVKPVIKSAGISIGEAGFEDEAAASDEEPVPVVSPLTFDLSPILQVSLPRTTWLSARLLTLEQSKEEEAVST